MTEPLSSNFKPEEEACLMGATHYGRCPTCGQGTFNAPYSCDGCVGAIRDPAGEDDGMTYENRDFDHEAAIDRGLFGIQTSSDFFDVD